jgi:serine/threonine protein kinase
VASEGSVVDGRYVLGPALGQGGMGVVYRARHKFTGAEVALKVLHAHFGEDADVSARFQAEARAPAAIAHPGIARVTDAGKTPEGELYLVMELLRGETLRERMARGRMPVDLAVWIVLGVLDALAAAHAARVVHRDLKPENVFLVAPNDVVKLLDFGIAKIANASSSGGMTATGAMMGTVEYMSPEQIRDTAHVDHRTDLWAAAVVLYEALTGAMPFPGQSHPEIVVAVLSRPATPPSRLADLPAGFDPFFARAFAPEAGARFNTADEMMAALAALRPGGAREATSVGGPRALVEATGGGPALGETSPAPYGSAPPAAHASPSYAPPPDPRASPSGRPPGPGTLAGLRSQPPPPMSSQPPYVGSGPPPFANFDPRSARQPANRRSPVVVVIALLAGLGVVALLVGLLLFVVLAPSPVGDRAACERACADLASCAGVPVASCVSECGHAHGLRAYGARGQRDCRAALAASLDDTCHDPAEGHASCRDTFACEERCTARGGYVETCSCACVHGAAESRAPEVANVNLCERARCPQECITSPNSARCIACMNQRCRAQMEACRVR